MPYLHCMWAISKTQKSDMKIPDSFHDDFNYLPRRTASDKVPNDITIWWVSKKNYFSGLQFRDK